MLLFALVSLFAVHATLAAPAGTLINPRWFHTATRLLDGRVLLAGGFIQADGGGFNVTDSCEIYDPATNTWTVTGSLNEARYSHEAVLLADGRVLVVGGRDLTGFDDNTCELYDPGSGTWSFTQSLLILPSGNLVLLGNGRVLAAGGGKMAEKCRLYDPGTGKWSATGSLNLGRGGFEATRLDDGRVLLVGGIAPHMPGFVRQTELYNPVTGTWSVAGDLNRARMGQIQVLLDDGRVLLAGGVVGLPSAQEVTRITELFDPNTANWTLGRPLTVPRAAFTANLLNDGNVFAAGGNSGDPNEALTSIEEFEPATGRWHLLTTSLATPRRFHTATTLLDGSILIAGGIGDLQRVIPGAEIFVTPQ